jgi:hypothetical protein
MIPFRDRRPVTEGEFPTGTELMLWRPGIDRRRLRDQAFSAAVFSSSAIWVLLGIALLAICTLPLQDKWTSSFVAVLIVAGYAVAVWVNYQCADYDHRHRPGKPCFLDRTRGEYHYHRGDFDDLPESVVCSANAIITTVHAIYASPAVTWLEPRRLHEIHRVAWNALSGLDQSRGLRKLVNDTRCQAISGDLVDARARLSLIDVTSDGILDCLQQVALLVHSWEQKLVESGLRSQLRAEVDNVPAVAMASTLHRAESLTEGVFAYVTAARDVTNAGPFAWEQAQP